MSVIHEAVHVNYIRAMELTVISPSAIDLPPTFSVDITEETMRILAASVGEPK